MAVLLDILALTAGLLGQPQYLDESQLMPEGGGQRDVTIHGIPATKVIGAPTGYTVNPEALADRAPTANVEDRRYMTSPYNPFMGQADRLGPQGYYMSSERKTAIELGKERKRREAILNGRDAGK
jgi:hypothetical protein